MKAMKVEELDEYRQDVKELSKKYRSISDDMKVVKKVLFVNPNERPPFSFRIDNLDLKTCVIKVKKIASRSFKGKGVNSGFRLIYAHFESENRIVLIELYHKSNKEIEDRERILGNFE
jgi:mRNA-degrading endonuclease RelE of RelBE toxin-antitoxin system